MKFGKIKKLIFFTAFCLSGCACPDVVETKKVGDQNLSCAQLRNEIEDCERQRRHISDEKGVTGKNVAAVVFFWPALLATYSNVSDALRAVDDRKAYLMRLYDEKKCHRS